MMNSREIVRRTLEYDRPDRVARSFGDSDFVDCGNSVKTQATDWTPVGGGRWRRVDEWGNRWARVDETSKGEVVKGVFDSPADIAGYEFPDYSNAADYATVAARRAEAPDKWLVGNMPGFVFNIARKLFKLEDYLVYLLIEPAPMRMLHDRIEAMLAEMIRNYAAAGVDSVMFCEDWGTQKQTLISPDLWREEFFPRFCRLCATAREGGIKVFMHSCGAIGSIVGGLAEAGIDLLQFDQPQLHGIDALAAHQEDRRITFWCPVDIQTTLQTRDESVIRAAARELLDKLWRGRGGFVAGYYGGNEAIGLDRAVQDWACEEFLAHGTQARYGEGFPSPGVRSPGD